MKYWYLYIPAIIFFAMPLLYASFKQHKTQVPVDREHGNSREEDEDNNDDDDSSGNIKVIIRTRM